MNDITQDDFDWREAQELTGCSDQQVAFVRSVCQGASLTQAARVAQYAGKGSSLRGQASRIHKSRKVQSLLALARSGDAGVTEDVISRDACKRELSRMIRHGDASQKVRCIEGLEKMRAEERASGQTDAEDGMGEDRLCRDLIVAHPNGATGYVLAIKGGNIVNACLFHDVAQQMQREWPEVLAKLVAQLNGDGRRELERQVADRNYQLWIRQKIWGEIGYVVDLTDNAAKRDPHGRSYITPTAVKPSYENADAMRARGDDRGGKGAEASNGKQAPAV